jgi:hypothetical protein
MSKRRQTFTDPRTGEEIESTTLAQWGAWLTIGLGGLFIGLVFGLILGLVGKLGAALHWLIAGLGLGLVCGVAFVLLFWVVTLPYEVRNEPLARWVHDGIARRQHRCRQRVLQGQEFAHVPDRALSRARPPGEPEPAAASLSLAEPPEEAAPRLAAGVEAETAAEEKVLAVQETL